MKINEHLDDAFSDEMNPQKDRWLTVREVATIFRVSRDTVSRWIHDGLLPAIDVSANSKLDAHRPSWRISSKDIKRFLKKRASLPPKPPRAKPKPKLGNIVEFIK